MIRRKPLIIGLITLALLLIAGLIFWLLYKGSLEIEAQIIYNMGGPQPVARQKFYLLDVDPASIDKGDPKWKAKLDAAKSEDERTILVMEVIPLKMLDEAARKHTIVEGKEKSFLGIVEKSRPLWEGHLVQEVQTDFQGKAAFVGLRPGDYWLMGMTETRAAISFWNLKVHVGMGSNKLILSTPTEID